VIRLVHKRTAAGTTMIGMTFLGPDEAEVVRGVLTAALVELAGAQPDSGSKGPEVADNRITITAAPGLAAEISALAEAVEHLGELVDLPLDVVDGLRQLASLHVHRLVATRAVQGGIALEPSDLLGHLVAAARAGNVDGLRV
jgi:hypothetical protein